MASVDMAGPGGGGGDDGGGGGGGDGGGPPVGYPAPPYGPNVGDVVPNAMFQGYFSPKMTSGLATAQSFGPVSFDDARKSGAKYMLVMFAGFS
jgi:hypothetical protein